MIIMMIMKGLLYNCNDCAGWLCWHLFTTVCNNINVSIVTPA